MENRDRGFSDADASASYLDAPFFRRVQSILSKWIMSEWDVRETIRREAVALGWDEARRRAYDEATLTAERLAQEVDKISLTKLRRELAKVGAPSPGQLIREARIAHACHLLVTGRLMIREVADRVGYGKEKHFTEVFTAAVGMTPSEYRRRSIQTRAEPRSVVEDA